MSELDRQQDERELRAARNQALFRAVNERMKSVQEALGEITDSLDIACECVDTTCIELLRIAPDEYERVRAHPRHFVIRPSHIDPSVEDLIAENATHAVVEKRVGGARDLAEAADVHGRSGGA